MIIKVLLGNKEAIPFYLTEDTLVYGSESIRLDDLEEYLQVEDRLIYYQIADPHHVILKVVPVQGILKKKECYDCYFLHDCFVPTGEATYYHVHINDLMWRQHVGASLEDFFHELDLEDI